MKPWEKKILNFSSAVPRLLCDSKLVRSSVSLFVYKDHWNCQPIEDGEKQNSNDEKGFNLENPMDQ